MSIAMRCTCTCMLATGSQNTPKIKHRNTETSTCTEIISLYYSSDRHMKSQPPKLIQVPQHTSIYIVSQP